jgi:hypothetical protein
MSSADSTTKSIVVLPADEDLQRDDEIVNGKPAKGKVTKDALANGAPWNSWLSFVTFSWVTPLIAKGNKVSLSHADLFSTPVAEDVVRLRQAFWEYIGDPSEREITRSQLFGAVVHVCKRDIVISGIAMFFFAMAQLANPILLRELIRAVAEGGMEGLYFAIALFVVAMISGKCGQVDLNRRSISAIDRRCRRRLTQCT